MKLLYKSEYMNLWHKFYIHTKDTQYDDLGIDGKMSVSPCWVDLSTIVRFYDSGEFDGRNLVNLRDYNGESLEVICTFKEMEEIMKPLILAE